jgi:ABC-type nitrate/sulfonate/bicarbonate transport system substrate-binding protein
MIQVAKPEIAPADDLKAKAFGICRTGSHTDLGLRNAAADFGLEPNQDTKMIQIRQDAGDVAMIQQGVIKGMDIVLDAAAKENPKAKGLTVQQVVDLTYIA